MPTGAAPIVYPSIEDVFNLARVHINDTFAGANSVQGEGRIFIDSWVPNLTILNAAIVEFLRDTEMAGTPTMRKEIFLNLIPPVNGASGIGVPDPTVQQHLGYFGFFDGTNLLGSPVLPTDLLEPLEIWQRTSGSGLTFTKLSKADNGLESLFQDFSLGAWEWRGDQIYWNGALIQKDVRLRYHSSGTFDARLILPANFASTAVPLADSLTPLAYKCAYLFSSARLPSGAANDMLIHYDKQVEQIINRWTRRSQRTIYEPEAYGESGGLLTWPTDVV